MGTISNSEIKLIKSLANKKFRDETGLFAVEGEKMVEEALASSFTVEKIYRKSEIGEEAMSRISLLNSPSPVLALVRKPSDIIVEKPSGIGNGLYLALDSLRDPGNLGTIIRVADWFGIDGIFATFDTVDVFNPKVVQATMGAVFRMKIQYTDLLALSDDVLARGGKVFGTFLDGNNMYGCELADGKDFPVVIVTGNESRGISDALAEKVSDRLYIPPYPHDAHTSESLNAAIATAITVAEFRRLG